MSQLILYGLAKCSTCVKARKWLDAQGVPHTFIDYRDNPVAPEKLTAWASSLGGWEKLANRASMTWRNLPIERKTPESDEQWLALIAEFPTLVRRPVADNAGTVGVGFSEKTYTARFLEQES